MLCVLDVTAYLRVGEYFVREITRKRKAFNRN